MQKQFSVLMSVYYKEKPEYLRECLDSLLNQTVQASEWVIVKDGPLTKELENILQEYATNNPGLIKFVELNCNVGLGLALREGITNCTNELVARMDTDDIAYIKRFELQLREFEKQTDLDICGSHIKEFENDINNIVSIRKVPLKNIDIYRYQKKRSAFNHMTVMFKKDAVIEAGNYEDCPLMEDDMLWVRMMLKNCNMKNIDDYLVFARVGKDMIKRRGGISYLIKYKKARKKIYETGFINFNDYILTIVTQIICSCLPVNLRKKIFLNFLRDK